MLKFLLEVAGTDLLMTVTEDVSLLLHIWLPYDANHIWLPPRCSMTRIIIIFITLQNQSAQTQMTIMMRISLWYAQVIKDGTPVFRSVIKECGNPCDEQEGTSCLSIAVTHGNNDIAKHLMEVGGKELVLLSKKVTLIDVPWNHALSWMHSCKGYLMGAQCGIECAQSAGAILCTRSYTHVCVCVCEGYLELRMLMHAHCKILMIVSRLLEWVHQLNASSCI